MAYPNWVLKHKKKGTYINKVGNNYYLYAAHSEHIPGTANKARRICDGYLGKITEVDGFIPKKQVVPHASLEYGLSCAITSLCKTTFLRIEFDYPNTFKEVIIHSILLFIYGANSARLQHLSFISLFISKEFILDEPLDFLVQRTSRMIQSTLSKIFPNSDDLTCFIEEMRSIHTTKFKNEWIINELNPEVLQLIELLKTDFEEDVLWKRLLK